MPSLKRTPDQSSSILSESEESYFPHAMYLDDKDIERLSLAGVSLGDEFEMVVTARVTSISTSEDEDSEKRTRMVLTLTEAYQNRGERDRAERLFKGE